MTLPAKISAHESDICVHKLTMMSPLLHTFHLGILPAKNAAEALKHAKQNCLAFL
jgi:hypothetical protein